MKQLLPILFSIGAAGFPAALGFAVYQSTTNSWIYFPSTFLLAGMYASCHALILGLPVALVLARFRLFSPIPMSVVGAVVGTLPLAVFTLLSPPDYWQRPLFLFASFAFLGAVGGLAFYFTRQALSPNNSFKPTPLRGAA
ncbi:hypothetical protein WCE34_14210 [Luteimonas sp. MJ204]|uniref:hypothetical protein n=1 Tax=Luteimonas sp. MJ145 TaxID=3129234 RepID=UPI0031BBB0A3